jgi:hypothetical protein
MAAHIGGAPVDELILAAAGVSAAALLSARLAN